MPKRTSLISYSPAPFVTVFKCNFTGNPKVNISWIHDSDIEGNYTSQYHDSGGLTWTVGMFNVTSVKRSGYHNVSCVGKNEFGKVEQTKKLKCKYLLCFSTV